MWASIDYRCRPLAGVCLTVGVMPAYVMPSIERPSA